MSFIIRHNFKIIIFILILFATLFFSLSNFWHTPLHKTKNFNFIIHNGYTIDDLLVDFDSKGISVQKKLIKLSLALFKPKFILKSGEYTLVSNSSLDDFFDLIHKGVSTQHKFKFIEGATFNQMLDLLKKNSKLQSLDEKKITTSFILDKKAIDVMGGDIHYEGWFLPDTYFFQRGDSWSSILSRSHLAMIDYLNHEWRLRQSNLPYKNFYEALIMASIIEKETGLNSERKKISGVLVKRLKVGMRLQVDPTIIYGMGDFYKGNLSKKDLLSDSKYNTYTRKGLPPTPISLPGKSSIHAALNPHIGSELYFVAKGDGSHYFSKDFKEHQWAVKHFQVLKRSDQYRSSPDN